MNRARGNSMNNMGGMTNNGMTPDVMERNLNGNQLNNGGSTYGINPNGGRLSGSLAEQIRALSFVKTELELYLDTHPSCPEGLKALQKLRAERAEAIRQYEKMYGKYIVTVGDAPAAAPFAWVNNPWPWENEANI